MSSLNHNNSTSTTIYQPVDTEMNPQNSNDDISGHSHYHLHGKIHLETVGHELKKFSTIFNSYATKKTIATGFFNIALVATNFSQMKQLIVIDTTWTALNIVLLFFVCLSLFLQFGVAVALVFLARRGEFIDEDKRNELIRHNNGVTILVLIISVINIFINIFLSV